MKRGGLKRFIRTFVAPIFPAFLSNDTLLYATPINSILRGVEFAPGGGASFRAVLFARPLYVPFSGTSIGYEYQIKKSWYSSEYWADAATIQDPHFLLEAIQAALTKIEKLNGPSAFLEHSGLVFPKQDHNMRDLALGLSLAKVERYIEAERMLSALVKRRPELPRGILASAQQALGFLTADSSSIGTQLDRWEQETIELYRSAGCKIEES